jgi:hypothetical protein
MLKRNVYTNPVGWAAALAGTGRRYLCVSLLTALAGFLLLGMVWLGDREGPAGVLQLVLLFILAVELPLHYLRALRVLLQEKAEAGGTKGDPQGL